MSDRVDSDALEIAAHAIAADSPSAHNGAGLLFYATGDWLTLFARQIYGIERGTYETDGDVRALCVESLKS